MRKITTRFGSDTVSLGRESLGMPFGGPRAERVGFLSEGRGEAIYPMPRVSARRVREVRAKIMGAAFGA